MRFVDLIELKAEGGSLTEAQIQEMIHGFVAGAIPDYQMSAMMMAILLKGMTGKEAADLTLAMMSSGDIVDLSDLPGIKLDKHSTGGVGDTTTLVVAPLVAACGGTVAKMSGRGLGHTGGTLDKLESIPGCCIEQSMETFRNMVKDNGVAVIGQTGNLVPADKMMYALRDVTATVRSIPLIASSIMSKKLASGADAIVLDVKAGSGAFMRTPQEAHTLAKLMVDIGALVGRRVTAVITDMNQPLGMAVGNALEVREAVEVLSEQVPEGDPLYEVCMLLGIQMLLMGELAATPDQARKMLREAIENGEGLRRLRRMVEQEGGDGSYLAMDRISLLCNTAELIDVLSEETGYVASMDAEKIGTAAQILGAGRAKKGDAIDHAVGLVMHVRAGDPIKAGEPLCTLYVNDTRQLDAVKGLMQSAVTISQNRITPSPMVYEIISGGND